MSKKSSTVSKDVMQRIDNGSVRMRPRVYFVLLAAMSFAAITGAALSLAYGASIVFFWVRIQTAETFAWGARSNLEQSLRSFPWWALVLAVGMLAATVWLVKKHSSLYRYKTSWVVAGIVGVSVVLGVIASQFGVGKNHTPDTQQNRAPGWQRNLNR